MALPGANMPRLRMRTMGVGGVHMHGDEALVDLGLEKRAQRVNYRQNGRRAGGSTGAARAICGIRVGRHAQHAREQIVGRGVEAEREPDEQGGERRRAQRWRRPRPGSSRAPGDRAPRLPANAGKDRARPPGAGARSAHRSLRAAGRARRARAATAGSDPETRATCRDTSAR